MDDHRDYTTPNHHPPRMDVLQKAFLQIILAARWLGRRRNTSPLQHSDDLYLRFCLILLLWKGRTETPVWTAAPQLATGAEPPAGAGGSRCVSPTPAAQGPSAPLAQTWPARPGQSVPARKWYERIPSIEIPRQKSLQKNVFCKFESTVNCLVYMYVYLKRFTLDMRSI